jgi:ABC-type uncharacterized transport system fused permease/ATPase subunit
VVHFSGEDKQLVYISSHRCQQKALLRLVLAYYLLQRVGSNLSTLLRRFWKVAAPYWSSEDKVQARLRLAGLFALTLATTGISVGFNFLGRDFDNALASKSD